MGMIFFFLIVSLLGFIPTKKASADTISLGSDKWAVINIDKSSAYYYPKDNVRASGTLYNGPSGEAIGTIEASIPAVSPLRDRLYTRDKDNTFVPQSNFSGLAIPSTDGTYQTRFYLSAYINTTETIVPDNYKECSTTTIGCNLTPTWSHYYQLNADSTYSPWYSPGGPVVNYKFVKTPGYSTFTDNYVTAEYNIPFSVITAIAKVIVTPTKSTILPGEEVGVSWYTENFIPTRCSCSYSSDGVGIKSCGEGIDFPQQGTNLNETDLDKKYAFTLHKTSTFTVKCDDNVTAPPAPTYTYYKLWHCTSASQYQTGPYLNSPYSSGRVVVGAVNNGDYNYRVIDSSPAPFTGLTNIQVTDSGGNDCLYKE